MKSPSFQFYAQDFLTGVMYLTNEEVGIYIKMLSKQWTDGKIPKKRLGLFVGYDWVNLSEEVRNKFTDKGEYVVNERLEVEREKKSNFLKKQSKNGKKGGRPLKSNNIKKPNESQINPLEDEDEKEVEIEYAYDYLIKVNKEKIDIFEMQNKKSFPDYNQFIENFNCKVVEEKTEWDFDILLARLRRLNSNWDKTPKKTNGSKMDELRKKLKDKTL